MTKVTWIIAAVVVIGVGIAAGMIFLGGTQPTAVAAADSTKGVGTSQGAPASAPEVTAPETPAASTTGEATQTVDAPVLASEPRTLLTLDELIANAGSLAGTEVLVRGAIVTQCIAGCQFSLEDGTGVIGVELIDDALENVLSRGSVGREVEVRGVVELSPSLKVVVDEPNGWRYLN